MDISTLYVQPGPYFKIEDVPAPIVSPGIFNPLFVGLGRKEVDVLKTLTRGATPNGEDLITDAETVISILTLTDNNGIVYTNGIDFQLAESSGDYSVDWDMPQSLIGTESLAGPLVLTDKTLKLNVNGTAYTVTFTVTETNITAIVSKINTVVANLASAHNTNYLKLTEDSVIITGGSALSTLGFINGQKAESKEPAAGVTYTVGYKRHKLSTEYIQKYFTRLEDIFAEYGALVRPTELQDGTPTTASSGTDVTDTAATFVANGVVPGNYVKITGGTGAGQIRVVQTVDSETVLNVYPEWDENPDTTSTYSVTDEGYYDISWACFYANRGGAQAFVACQTPDDIVNDDNWRGAIDKTEQFVSGQQGFCLVPLKGLTYGDSLVSYIMNYINTVNSTVGDQERTALIGVASNITHATLLQLLNGIGDENIGVVVNPYVTNGGVTFGSEYLASQIAGIFCNPDYDAGEPISGKIIAGFDYIDDPYLMNEKRLIGQNGGILVQQDGVSQRIVHFLSTNQTDVNKAELKVAKQKATIKKVSRTNIKAGIIYSRSNNLVVPRTESLVRTILDELKRTTQIADYENLSVSFLASDSRQLNISFKFKPTLDVDWVLTTFGATL